MTIRCGAALTFGVGAGAEGTAGVMEVAVWVADGLADGEGVAPCCGFGGGTGEK